MENYDLIALIALSCIWLLLMVNQVLVVAGYIYYIRSTRFREKTIQEYPMVSIMVPAHNESKVIGRTVESLLNFDYPKDKYEIIVVNDNSSDNSHQILADIQHRYPDRRLIVLNTDHITGGKGKSNALNLGFEKASGELLAIYDADNTPERDALRYLVSEIVHDEKLGAVIGKFRTRNKNVNLLTRFINIETLSFQWMAQAGRWQMMKLCTIPGTNFIIRRSIIESIGGWDPDAIAEDTEISFRIYLMGYAIKFIPHAVTWEQEPQTLKVWFKQRTRWVKGNIYVLIKNLPLLFSRKTHRIQFDMLYFLSIYFLLLTSLVISDVLLILNAIGYVHVTLAGLSILLWMMAILLFTISTFITLTTEKGELTLSNFFVTLLMYFTYCKMWMVVAVYGAYQYLMDIVFKRTVKWYKTERF